MRTRIELFRRGGFLADAPWRLLLLSAMVGVIAGLGAIGFYLLLDGARWLLLEQLAGYRAAGPGGEPSLFPESTRPFSRWVFFILPAVGGLVSGWLVWAFAPEAAGHGTDAAIRAYHFGGKTPTFRLPFIKAISAAITIGSGGSGGREGPIAQIGSGFGGLLAAKLGLTNRERRILMAAGVAGGVGAIFHAPMAGAIFAAEVLYRDLDLEFEVIIPSIVSSVIAYAIFAGVFGWDPLFLTPDFRFENPAELLPYFGLAVVVAMGAILYTRCFYAVHGLFAKLRLHPALKPAIGGVLAGCVGLLIPAAMGTGYGTLQQALANGTELTRTVGAIGAGLLLAVAAGKTLTTAFSIGSGGSGGVFGPAIVVGGALGGAFGLLFDRFFPGFGIQPGAFALVGMTGFFAAAANTPLSTVIMVSEMTGNYHLLVPSLWVCTMAYLFCGRWHLYAEQLRNRFEAPIHLENMMTAVLRGLSIRALVETRHTTPVASLPADMPLDKLLEQFARLASSSFAVADAQGHLVGVIRGRDLRRVLNTTPDLHAHILASDLMIRPVRVQETDNLLTAVTRMKTHDVEEVLVSSETEPDRIVAVVSHRNIIDAYYAQIRVDTAA